MRVFVFFAVLWWPFLCAPAGAQSEAATQSGYSPAQSESWRLLEKIAGMGAGRQVGQPGNAAVEGWVEETFREYAARQNPPSSDRESGVYQHALDALMESHSQLYLEEVSALQPDWDEPQSMAAAAIGRFERLLQTPGPFYVVFGVALCMLAAAWWFQRRPALLWAGALVIFLIVGVAVASWRLQAATVERLLVEGPGAREIFEQRSREFLEAARALREAGKGRWQSGRLTHDTAAFIPGNATLQAGGEQVRLYQMAPNLVDPANLSEPVLEGPLIYAGAGRFDQLQEVELSGSIVLLEFNSGRQWLSAVELGASAVVLLEPPPGEELSFYQASLKTSNSPLSIPRFYLRRKDATRLFGEGWETGLVSGSIMRLEQEAGRWERLPVYADWIYIPSADPGAVEELVHIQTYKDAASIVPELSPGAEGALNLVAVKELLEVFAQKPPARPVLISVVNDHCNALNGEFVFSAMAFTPASVLAEELERIDILRSQHLLIGQIYGQEPAEPLLNYLRHAIERVAGRSYTVKEPIVNHLTMRRNTLRGEENLLRFELDSLRADAPERQAGEERLKALAEEVEEVIAILGLFNRFGHQTFWEELAENRREALGRIFRQLAGDARKEMAQLDAERRQIWGNMAFRNQLASSKVAVAGGSLQEIAEAAFPALPSLAAFHLDLAAGAEDLGFFHIGEMRKPWGRDRFAGERVSRLARLTLAVARELRQETSDPATELPRLRDTVLKARGLPPSAHLALPLDFGSRAFHQFARPALTLTTVEDQRPVVFTPQDMLERLNPARVDRILAFTRSYFPRLVDEPRLSGTVQSRGTSMPFAVELTVRKMDRFSVEIPRTVLGGAVILGFPRIPPELEPIRQLGQVRPFPILVADSFGRQTLRGDLWREASLLAFGFDHDFRKVTAAQDFGENEKRFSSTLNLTERTLFAHRSIVTFECEKSDLLGLTQPLTLRPILEIEVLDGRNDTWPRHYAVAGVAATGVNKRIPLSFDGSASVFFQPDIPFKIKAGNVIAVQATDENLEGVGFPIANRIVRELPLIMASDYHRLAESNIDLLTSKGVAMAAAEAFNQEAGAVLEKLPEAGTPGERLLLSEVARGLGFQAYVRTMDTITDLVRAVIILLALVVPFCFFLVKLISPFTDINRQIVFFMATFAFFAVVLYFIQPAFHVGDRPEIVILAFVILGLAGFVGSVIVGRFNASMAQAVEQSQLSESPDAPQGRLAGVAFIVGVNNMKRRRIRTTLTCATIVLVTFTILSVISVQQDAEPMRLRTGAEAPYDGFVFTSPGLAPIEPLQLDRVRSHFEDQAVTVARAWTSRQDEFGGYMPFRILPRQARPEAELDAIEASLILGLEIAERDFLAPLDSPDYLVPGSRWFSANDAEEVILSRRAAALMGLSGADIGQEVLILNGREYLLVGLFEDAAFEELRDLRNLPFLPLKVDPTQVSEKESASGEGDVTQLPGVSTASPLEVAFFPIDTALTFGPTTYRSLAVKYLPLEDGNGTTSRVWQDVQQFLRFQDAYLAAGFTDEIDRGEDLAPLEPGEYFIASSSAAAIGGGLKIAIPVILAATIILNTMLGSVMERKREISIYNAIGLNPTHVMIFFLAEALVFGLVGSVAGYFIGQVMSVGIGQFLDLNLNYSSLSVMVVIFLTIATVMLSTIYPAMLAARAAVPSGQRRWSLPRPEGDEIHLEFPFSYDSRRILGVCAYLNDFMQQNSEASTGKFLARLRAVGKVPTIPRGHRETEALSLVYNIAPIPFDLGVNQVMEIYADYDSRVRAHMLSVHLTRESGDQDSWRIVNQPFLEALRKRLLAWRSQRAEVQETYCNSGEALFRDTGLLPVRNEVSGLKTREEAVS